MEQNMIVIKLQSPQTNRYCGTARMRRMNGYAEVELRWSGSGEQKEWEVFLLTSKGMRAVHPRVGTAPLRSEDTLYGVAAMGQGGVCVCCGSIRGYEPEFREALVHMRLCFAAAGEEKLQRVRTTADAPMERDIDAALPAEASDAKEEESAAIDAALSVSATPISTLNLLKDETSYMPLAATPSMAMDNLEYDAKREAQPEPDGTVVSPSTRHKAVLGREPEETQEEESGRFHAPDGAYEMPRDDELTYSQASQNDAFAFNQLPRAAMEHTSDENNVESFHTKMQHMQRLYQEEQKVFPNAEPQEEPVQWQGDVKAKLNESFYTKMQHMQRMHQGEQKAALHTGPQTNQKGQQNDFFAMQGLQEKNHLYVDENVEAEETSPETGQERSKALQDILQRASKIFPRKEYEDSGLAKMYPQEDLSQESMHETNPTLFQSDSETNSFKSFLPSPHQQKAPPSPKSTGYKKPLPKKKAPLESRQGKILQQEEECYIGRPQRCDNPFPHQFPGSSWVRVRQAEGAFYLEGRMRRGTKIVLITAVPGRYSPIPPKNLPGFGQFIQTHDGGFWVKVMKDER